MKNPLEEARQLILQYDWAKVDFSKGFDYQWGTYYDNLRKVVRRLTSINTHVLHDSLGYFIDIDETHAHKNQFGYSKEGGVPHLPANWEKPKEWGNYDFLVQINVDELKRLDIENVLPAHGIIYIFQHKEEGSCKIYYYKGSQDVLVQRDDLPGIVHDEKKITFKPGFLFHIRGDNEYQNIYHAIPEDLRVELEKILSCKMYPRFRPSWGMFVMPSFWQGEREDFRNEVMEIAEEILLLQTEVDDVSIHIWIDKVELLNERFEKAYETFSTT
jgi:hypothetical protein